MQDVVDASGHYPYQWDLKRINDCVPITGAPISVHPEDRHLLGMEWDGKWYVDTALLFGLSSAPKIFTALADGLIWIMFSQGVRAAIYALPG